MSAHQHGPVEGRRLGLSVLLTVAFVGVEAAAGWWANSLALLTDAGHNLADALALFLSWYAVRQARRPADARRTFGYHRVGVLAALANALSLVVIAGVILSEAVRRLQAPPEVQAGPMIGVAAVAIVLNVVIALWLRGEAGHDLNIRSADLHMVGDAASALGVVLAGVVVALTGSRLADPVVSVLIAGFLLWSSWGVLAEAVGVLLESAPRGLDVGRVAAAAAAVPGVAGVYHLHVWAVGSGLTACSLHVVVPPGASLTDAQAVQRQVAQTLADGFAIGHTTVQVEVEGCGVDGLNCAVPPVHRHEHDH